MLTKKRLQYQIGLSPERLQLSARRHRLGLTLVVVGPLLAFLGGMGAAVMFDGLTIPAIVFGMGPGVLLLVVGIVFFAMSTMAVLRVMRSDGMYVWLEGADPQFLSTLSESPVRWDVPRHGLLGRKK